MTVETHADFNSAVARYRTAIAETGIGPVDDRAAEVAVEGLRDWSRFGTLDELREWFLGQRSTNPMTVTRIPVDDCRGWFVEDGTGYIRHDSGEFFVVETIEVQMSATREVGEGGWCQPVLTQVGDDGGILGLVRKRFDGVPHYLVQAKAEPGNYGLVQLSPAIQATFSNLKRAHGGNLPTYAWYFYPEVPDRCELLADVWFSEDGGRLFNKRNRGMIVELAEDEDVELTDEFRWVSLWQIKQLFHEDAWVNPHLFRLISLIGV
jgi:oxidase EvaA